MGIRFQKSINLGPVRLNLSKSGVGVSVGVKGVRVSRTAKGKYRKTVSIPGTGISYSEQGDTIIPDKLINNVKEAIDKTKDGDGSVLENAAEAIGLTSGSSSKKKSSSSKKTSSGSAKKTSSTTKKKSTSSATKKESGSTTTYTRRKKAAEEE